MSAKTTGFASPAQGYETAAIDLNSLLIPNPASTYLYRLESGEMADLGLPKGAILIVDRSKPPIFNKFALIRHEGQFLCRLLTKHQGKAVFTNGRADITPIPDETEIIGAVTASINEHSNGVSDTAIPHSL